MNGEKERTMKTSIIKILFIAVALCIFINVGYQIYLSLSNPYETETVYEYTMEDAIPIDGLIFKDETVITGDPTGVVNYLVTNGSHVAVHSEVARIYQNQDDISVTAQIELLNQQIARLSEAQSIGLQETDLSVIEKEFSHSYDTLIENLQQENLTNLSEETNDITTLLNKKQMITGKVQDFDDSIQLLTDQKKQLESSITSQPQSMIAPAAGYFVDHTDGYEGMLSLDYADSITLSELQELLNQDAPPVPAENVAKVITDPTLELVGIVPAKYLINLKTGISCTLRFSDLGIEVPSTIKSVQLEPNQGDGLLICSIDYMSDRISTARKDHVDAIVKTYDGLRVPKTAVRTNDAGEQGVYVTNNASMNFRKIDIIYENEEYVLSKPHADDSSYLRLYDTIIVQGKDLYDNKPIRS